MISYDIGQMRRLTYNEVIEINKQIGEGGVIQNNNLEFIMDKAKDIEDPTRYATALLFEITRAHSFTNGNKRTAFYAFAEFLKLNDYALRKGSGFNDKIEKVLNDIAEGKAEQDKVKRLVKSLIEKKG